MRKNAMTSHDFFGRINGEFYTLEEKIMNSFMIAFGLASVALCLGTLLRAKVGFLRNMLVPASVIAGILGLLFMNIVPGLGVNVGTDASMYTDIVNHLFTISFISISLTGSSEQDGNTTKSIFKGALAMGTLWCFLYALTPLLGMLILAVLGKGFDMDVIYGSLIQFGFAQGPGQAAAYGALYESYGWENASMVAVTFATLGFVVAFGIGIPIAKYGISKGIAKNCGKIDPTILKGYYKTEEQVSVMNRDTTCNSNIETLSFHFALIGLCYVLALGIAKLFTFLPGFLGSSMSGLMFMNGMYAAYIVKAVMKKLKIDFLQDDALQSKITGWTADYLVVCAFMAVGFSVIKQWLLPIIIIAVVVSVVTFLTCVYFGQRIGGSNDFERVLGLFGTCTGTVPSGIALIRIVDPGLKTNTAVELGLMNLVMLLCTPVYIVLLGYAAGAISSTISMIVLAALSVVYLVILKLTKCWNKPTFSWK